MVHDQVFSDDIQFEVQEVSAFHYHQLSFGKFSVNVYMPTVKLCRYMYIYQGANIILNNKKICLEAIQSY